MDGAVLEIFLVCIFEYFYFIFWIMCWWLLLPVERSSKIIYKTRFTQDNAVSPFFVLLWISVVPRLHVVNL